MRREKIKMAGRECCREAVVHAVDVGLPREIGDVSIQILTVSDEEPVAVDHASGRIERVGLAVEPVSICVVSVELAFHPDVLARAPFESASQP